MRQLCELAGVDYETSEGVADFYSLRHTGITRYILGHTLTETVIFARHSDPKLTILRYGHLEDNEVERRLRGLSLKKYGLDIRPADAGDDDSNEPGSDAPACVKQAGASDVAAMNICVENLDCEMDWNRTDLDGFLESNIDELVSGDNASASEEKPLFSRGFIEKTRVENMVCPTGIEPATCAL
ncbi:hypothetical protein AGMMS49959_07320 [Planctomycetales bacterium]|nr:hypothetical protein AGMMS49959_07320 [Planctomycetales bacterium]